MSSKNRRLESVLVKLLFLNLLSPDNVDDCIKRVNYKIANSELSLAKKSYFLSFAKQWSMHYLQYYLPIKE